MAYTDSDLTRINVFPNTTIYNNNLSNLATGDLNLIKQTAAELATEGGGIIAQSIGTNGYIKFANGLIIQWGIGAEKSYGKTGSWAFPVSQVTSFTYPLAASTTLMVIPVALCTSHSANSNINLAAFYSNATGTGFIHHSLMSWEITVTWKPGYVAFCK